LTPLSSGHAPRPEFKLFRCWIVEERSTRVPDLTFSLSIDLFSVLHFLKADFPSRFPAPETVSPP
jgi:hypothetical protein